MTDEEMAKEYLKKEGFRFGKFGELDDITSSEANKEIEQAFLAGLKAGRPKWHKVADGDLPTFGKPCLVYLVNDCVIIARLREDNVWTTNGHNAFENVIAWCEISKYTEV